jgi:hypothetical protein
MILAQGIGYTHGGFPVDRLMHTMATALFYWFPISSGQPLTLLGTLNFDGTVAANHHFGSIVLK